MVVHGEQSFTHPRPLHAGDVVVAQTTIESIKALRSLTTIRWLVEHGFDASAPGCEIDVLRAQA